MRHGRAALPATARWDLTRSPPVQRTPIACGYALGAWRSFVAARRLLEAVLSSPTDWECRLVKQIDLCQIDDFVAPPTRSGRADFAPAAHGLRPRRRTSQALWIVASFIHRLGCAWRLQPPSRED